MFSLPENLSVVAALQRCPTPRLLAGIRLRGLSSEYRTYLLVSHFSLKPLGNIPTEGIKIIRRRIRRIQTFARRTLSAHAELNLRRREKNILP